KSRSFQASWGWAYGFMKRFNLSLRSFTTTVKAGHLREKESIETKVSEFRRHLAELQRENQYSDDCIINMDETPVWFETAPSRTIHRKGDKEVPLIVSSQHRHRITVTLAVTKSGKMLPPTIIEKSQSKAAKER